MKNTARKSEVTQCYVTADEDDFVEADWNIKYDEVLMQDRAELRTVAQLYELVSEKNPADYFKKLNHFNAKFCQIEAAVCVSSRRGFFDKAVSAMLKSLIEQAHEILLPFMAMKRVKVVI